MTMVNHVFKAVQIAVSAWTAKALKPLKNKLPDTDKLTGSRLTKGYSIQVPIDSRTKAMGFESPRVLLEKLDSV